MKLSFRLVFFRFIFNFNAYRFNIFGPYICGLFIDYRLNIFGRYLWVPTGSVECSPFGGGRAVAVPQERQCSECLAAGSAKDPRTHR